MANTDITTNVNYTNLHADTKTALATAAAAIRATFTDAETNGNRKANVRAIFHEIIKNEEKTA